MARLFIGFKIYPGKNLLNFYNDIKNDLVNSRINWVDPENFHITLKFLGEIPVSKIDIVNSRLVHVAQRNPSFELKGSNFGYFGKLSAPKVFWLGYVYNKKLETLQTHIDEQLSSLGFPKENREYFPHLTLARIKYLQETTKFQEIIRTGFLYNETYMINDFQLIESKLSSTGPSYNTVSIFHLNN